MNIIINLPKNNNLESFKANLIFEYIKQQELDYETKKKLLAKAADYFKNLSDTE